MKAILLAAMLIGIASAAYADSYDELNAGIQFYNLGQWAEVIPHMDAALAANDLVPGLQYVAHLDRGLAQQAMNHADLAVADFSVALQLQPKDAEVLAARARLYFLTGKLEEASADLESLVSVEPAFENAYAMRAAIAIRRGQPEKARENLKTAFSLLRENTKRGRDIGLLAWESGDVAEADKDFQAGISGDRKPAYAWLWYSLTQAQLGKDVPRSALPDDARKQWPGPIVGFFLGETGQEAVFAAAAQGDPKAIDGQACEANFYIGEWLLQHKESAAAAPPLHKAASMCPTEFIEWIPAQMDSASLP
jgi:lipoprotein NlpI